MTGTSNNPGVGDDFVLHGDCVLYDCVLWPSLYNRTCYQRRRCDALRIPNFLVVIGALWVHPTL